MVRDILNWGVNEIVVFSFTTPNQTAPNELAVIDLVEGDAYAAYRKVVLSKSPCDLSNGVATGQGIAPVIYYTVGSNTGDGAELEPNTTYYYNVVNRNPDGSEGCMAPIDGSAPNCKSNFEMRRPKSLNALPAGTPNYSSASCNSGGGSGTPAAPFAGNCPGFTNTYHLNLDWKTGSGKNYFMPFTANEVGVVSFVTPATPGSLDSYIAFAESRTPPTPRLMALSETPCDFTNYLVAKSGMSGTFGMNIGSGSFGFGITALKPNTRYYVNVANRMKNVNSADTCINVSCELLIEFHSYP
jgi:hypothetical protein